MSQYAKLCGECANDFILFGRPLYCPECERLNNPVRVSLRNANPLRGLLRRAKRLLSWRP